MNGASLWAALVVWGAMICASSPLILGSGSPRRAEILTQLKLPFQIVSPSVDETIEAGELALAYVERIVSTKAEEVRRLLGTRAFSGLLVADTVVTAEGEILGKPRSSSDALRMLERLVGRSHQVLTRYRVERADHSVRARTVSTEVRFRHATQEELERYVQTGEGLDKAGSYAVQGLGAFLVERIEGSYLSVVGLPACELVSDLRELGLLGAYP